MTQIRKARQNASKILAMKKDGKSIIDICEKLAISQSGVKNFLVEYNKLSTNNTNISPKASKGDAVEIARQNQAKIFQMRNEGKKYSEICQAISGLTLNAIKTIITSYNKENNISTPHHRPKKTKYQKQTTNTIIQSCLPNFAINNGVLTIESTSELKVSFDGKKYTFTL